MKRKSKPNDIQGGFKLHTIFNFMSKSCKKGNLFENRNQFEISILEYIKQSDLGVLHFDIVLDSLLSIASTLTLVKHFWLYFEVSYYRGELSKI